MKKAIALLAYLVGFHYIQTFSCKKRDEMNFRDTFLKLIGIKCKNTFTFASLIFKKRF